MPAPSSGPLSNARATSRSAAKQAVLEAAARERCPGATRTCQSRKRLDEVLEHPRCDVWSVGGRLPGARVGRSAAVAMVGRRGEALARRPLFDRLPRPRLLRRGASPDRRQATRGERSATASPEPPGLRLPRGVTPLRETATLTLVPASTPSSTASRTSTSASSSRPRSSGSAAGDLTIGEAWLEAGGARSAAPGRPRRRRLRGIRVRPSDRRGRRSPPRRLPGQGEPERRPRDLPREGGRRILPVQSVRERRRAPRLPLLEQAGLRDLRGRSPCRSRRATSRSQHADRFGDDRRALPGREVRRDQAAAHLPRRVRRRSVRADRRGQGGQKRRRRCGSRR